jgi:non-ribosomal peptide synthase protein (TIGR01720 family)
MPSEPRDSDIAIVGMACRVPGAADLAAFWRNLCDGVESISTFSREALIAAGVPAALVDRADYVRAGGALEGIDLFDAGLFDMNAKEAALTDPQHRILLESAWTALEHAGCAPSAFDGAIGCYVGAGVNGYLPHNVTPSLDPLEPTLGYAALTGNSSDFLATRLSYKLGLKGPSVSLQTACSTSLVAVHAACQALISGECDLALAGGVAVRVPHHVGYLYQEGMIFSPDGHVRAFDARAQGTVGGNGAGIVVLQRLGDALAQGATVHAVVRGSAVNNDGSVKVGFTAPSIDGQAQVIAEAQRVAEIEPESIGYIEAHGTGTDLGDPIEVAALIDAFGPCGGKRQFCGIGSVKTNIGHLDAAAGVVSLIKAALAVKHGSLPPSLNFERPNPKIDFAASPFRVVTRLDPWPRTATPRRAGVSAFGIGGTNAHVVLEEAPPAAATTRSRPWHILPLSAQSPAALDTSEAALAAVLTARPDIEIADVAASLALGRTALRRRSIRFAQNGTATHMAERDHVPSGERLVAFLFAGQGAQRSGMGKEAYAAEPDFRAAFDRCATILAPHIGADLRRLLFETGDLRINDTAFAQPALFAVEYAMAQQFLAWGIAPEAMIGHSLGEYVAACLAGVFELEDALTLVAERGRLMQALPRGAMLAVPLAAQTLQPLLPAAVSVAAINAPSLTVISGPPAEIDAVEDILRARGTTSRRLETSHAFHSAMMDPMIAAFRRRVAALTLRPPRLPYVSNLTGGWIRVEEATDPDYWVRHLREPVRFADGLTMLLQEPQRLLLDIGPGRVLAGLATRHPMRSDGHRIVSASDTATAGVPALTAAAAHAWLAGAPLDWRKYFAGERRRRVTLPTYPFERQRYWIEPKPITSAPPEARRALADWFYVPSWRRLPPAAALAPRHRVLIGNASAIGESAIAIRVDDLARHLAAETEIVFVADDNARALGDLAKIVRAIHRSGVKSARLAVATFNAVTVADETPQPWQAALHGLLKVVRQEHPHIECRAIDVSRPPDRALLRAELNIEASEPMVALRGGHRWAPDVAPLNLAPMPTGVKRNGVYLIFGGFGAIGFALAQHLAQSAAAKLVLAGRSAPNKERIGALAALGAEVATIRGDLAESRSIETAVGFAVERFGRLDGVIVAAGERRVGAILDLDAARLESEVGIRLAGLGALARAMSDRPVDFVLVMSSLSSLIGAIGFGAYAAAHAAVDAFVEAQRGKATRWIAVNWDNWQSGEAPVGIPEADGIEATSRILANPHLTRVAVSTTDLPQRLARWSKLDFLKAPAAAREAKAPAHARPPLATAYLAPRSLLEQQLAGIWQGLLGYDRIGVEDNLFELGADSILGIQFAARAREAALAATLKDFFTHQTVAALAAALGGRNLVAAEQRPVVGSFRPSAIQRWFFELDLAKPSHFNQSVLLETRVDLDPTLLDRALQAIMTHHDLLRARVSGDGGAPLVHIDPPADVPSLTVIDLFGKAAELPSRIAAAQSSLDLGHGPLFRAMLFRFGPREPGRLLLVAHHLLVDIHSWRLIVADLHTAYAQLADTETVRLAQKTTSFREWAELMNRHAASETVLGELPFWRDAGAHKMVALRHDERHGDNVVGSEEIFSITVDTAVTSGVLRRGVVESLLAALACSLAACFGRGPIMVELEGHGRDAPVEGIDVSRTVGWFTAPYPLVLNLNAATNIENASADIARGLKALPAMGANFAALRYLSPARDRLADLPKPELAFLYVGRVDDDAPQSTLFRLAAEPSGPNTDPNALRPYKIEVNAMLQDDRLRVDWHYSHNLHRRETIESLATAFADALGTNTGPETVAQDFADTGLSPDELGALLARLEAR